MGILLIVIILWVYVWLQEAISIPIDNSVPFYKEIWDCTVADGVYRMLRIIWCIAIAFTLQWWLFIWIGCYALAWLFKNIFLYFVYRD